MEISSDCTVSARPGARDLCWLGGLTLGVLLVHGFHPWAEDGGLYVAGVESLLNPAAFPADRAFVTAPLHFSIFAPFVAALVRFSHASLAAVLLFLYLFTTALMLWAAWRVARLCFPGRLPQWIAVALLATWWTLPVAGTSLLLMDPYVTARSFSTPLTLLAAGEVLQWRRDLPAAWRQHRPGFRRAIVRDPRVRCALWLLLAAAFHPLMAIYTLGVVLLLCLLLVNARVRWYVLAASLVIALAAGLQWGRVDQTPFAAAAVASRYYWFLSQWQWYEWLGLAGPLVVLAWLLYARRPRLRGPLRDPNSASSPSSPSDQSFRALGTAGILSGLLAIAISLLFAREHAAIHTVARLQPLRAFLPIYLLLPLLLGGAVAESLARPSGLPPPHAGPYASSSRGVTQGCFYAVLLGLPVVMFCVQRATFPQSPHIEWPGLVNRNPWVQAFLWIRDRTPADALVALDARYVNTPGEDAQGFRAIARRSALPDYSKDGGEAANFPRLAPAWGRSAQATASLSQLTDAQRRMRLRGLGVQWIVLQNPAPTALPCPYDNGTVKVCRF